MSSGMKNGCYACAGMQGIPHWSQCERRCLACDGWGAVADTKEGGSWRYWAELPPGADLAVRLGIVRPVRCAACEGSGTQP